MNIWIFRILEKSIELYSCLVSDEDLAEEARLGSQRDPVTSDRVHHFGRALVEEGQDGVSVPLLLEVVPERRVQHLVERETSVHLGDGFVVTG